MIIHYFIVDEGLIIVVVVVVVGLIIVVVDKEFIIDVIKYLFKYLFVLFVYPKLQVVKIFQV